MAKGKSAKHTGCRRGTKVVVKLRTGGEIVDVFHERNDKFIFLKNNGKIPKADISSFQALRGGLIKKYEGKN